MCRHTTGRQGRDPHDDGTPTPWYKARSKPALPPSAYYAQRSPSGGGRGYVPPLIVKRCRVLGLRVGRWLCVLCRLVFYCSCACSCSWCSVAVVACVCSSGCVPTSWSGGVVLGWSCRSRRVLGASRTGPGPPGHSRIRRPLPVRGCRKCRKCRIRWVRERGGSGPEHPFGTRWCVGGGGWLQGTPPGPARPDPPGPVPVFHVRSTRYVRRSPVPDFSLGYRGPWWR